MEGLIEDLIETFSKLCLTERHHTDSFSTTCLTQENIDKVISKYKYLHAKAEIEPEGISVKGKLISIFYFLLEPEEITVKDNLPTRYVNLEKLSDLLDEFLFEEYNNLPAGTRGHYRVCNGWLSSWGFNPELFPCIDMQYTGEFEMYYFKDLNYLDKALREFNAICWKVSKYPICRTLLRELKRHSEKLRLRLGRY
jgi:hypothetical protein